MWKIKGKDLEMNCGDFGIALPINITNVLETDIIQFKIYDLNRNEILNKKLPFEEGKWNLELTKEESDLLEEKDYMYSIMQFRENVLQNTINEDSWFKVT